MADAIATAWMSSFMWNSKDSLSPRFVRSISFVLSPMHFLGERKGTEEVQVWVCEDAEILRVQVYTNAVVKCLLAK